MVRGTGDVTAPDVDEVVIREGGSLNRGCNGVVKGDGELAEERDGANWDGVVGDHKEGQWFVRGWLV